MNEDMIYKCLDCGEELLVKRASKTMDGRSCSKCNGHVVPNRYADNSTHSKPKNTVTVGIEMVGYEKMKQQLRNLEATFDRILEKQEKIRPDVEVIRNSTERSEIKSLVDMIMDNCIDRMVRIGGKVYIYNNGTLRALSD